MAIQKLRAFFLEMFAVKQLLALKLLNQTKWNLEVQVKEYQDQKFGIAYHLPLKTQKISLLQMNDKSIELHFMQMQYLEEC